MQTTIGQKIAESVRSEPPQLTSRDSVYLPDFPKKAKAVIGMRRAGKTTFLHQKRGELLAAGNPPEQSIYFNFEDDRLAGMQAADLSLILEEYYRQFPTFREKETVTFFLDEIQLVPGWEQFARRILDSENIDLYLSGSSARLLSREVATSMRGRAVEATVYPFSFAEALTHAGMELPSDASFLSGKERSTIEYAFASYLTVGGFPECQGENERDRRNLLQGYVDIVILRDIAERHNLTNLTAIRWLVRQLLANAGGAFSATRFHKDLKSQKIPVSVEGLLDIYGHLQDAFLIHGLHIETDSERKRKVNPLKTYPIDPGLIHAFDRTGRTNIGHALENTVLIELLRRGAEVTWVRTPKGYEIDFFARFPDGTAQLIQVAATLGSPETAAREFRALTDARKIYPDTPSLLLTQNREPNIPVSDDVLSNTQILPAYEWLLGTA